MVAEVGHYVVHNVNQQWDHPLLLVTVEHHVQQMSQHLTNKVHIYPSVSLTPCPYKHAWQHLVMVFQNNSTKLFSKY